MIRMIVAKVTVSYENDEMERNIRTELEDPLIRRRLKEIYGKGFEEDIEYIIDEVKVAGKNSESTISIELCIYGDLIHKPDWYKERQDNLHTKLYDKWLQDLRGVELVIATTLHPIEKSQETIPLQ